MDNYQSFIALSRYARWLPDKNRRETWDETVSRYVTFWASRYGDSSDNPILNGDDLSLIKDAIHSLNVMPSMRALMTAGPALERDNVAGFNCSYVAINRQRAFDEIMYILMCGTGVGFSVERQDINRLPQVAEEFNDTETTIVVKDSKIGWASAYRELISLLYSGKIPRWDVSKVRPAGAQLKVFGGRASGPEPLEDLFRFTIEVFKNARGRQLNSLECHDLVCKIGEVVVVGGVRRSACISLSNLSDIRMRGAKAGYWFDENPQRALANNSVCYTEKPDVGVWLDEFTALYKSKSGERGIFNRVASQKQAERTGRRDHTYDFGTNPCGEIILRDRQFCNLSEVVVRSGDTFEDLKRKVRIATILGTLQSTLTDFRYLSKKWRDNTEEERLLGVSLTGIMDHDILSGKGNYESHIVLQNWLKDLKDVAIETNKEWAERLGIPRSMAVTTVKPSGTVSQLVDSASGIHPRYSPFYVRTVRADKKDPLAQMMQDKGFPCEDDVTKPDSVSVFSFPKKSPEGSIFRDYMTATEQLNHWMIYKQHWCEHNPSITVYVREDEWMDVGAWVFKNFDEVGGITFLPHSDHVYRQAPYQEIDEEKYKLLLETFPKDIDWNELSNYEVVDNTAGNQTLSCTGGVCEIVDLTDG